MTTTFYVPIENRSLPADDPTRWHILVVEGVQDKVDALMLGTEYRRTLPRTDSQTGAAYSYTVWGAHTTLPTTSYMQYLRDTLDARKVRRQRDRAGAHALSDTFRAEYGA